jgi:hypothetical protein
VSKKIAISQSNYIPWKGYFNLIKCVDEFILLDNVQYTRRDWRNRNLIKTPHGPRWLTIPVDVKGQFDCTIEQVRTFGNAWRQDHWNMLSQAYRKALFFDQYKDEIRAILLESAEDNLSKINLTFIKAINLWFDIHTPIRWAHEFTLQPGKNERLIDICRHVGATVYLSGPAAKGYLDEGLFAQHGIAVEWANYEGFPEYEQLYPPFVHGVSVLDLLFNKGPNSPNYLKPRL